MGLSVRLTSDQRISVETLRRDASLSSRDRNRVEIVLLADSGVRVATIAAHIDCFPATVLRVIHGFAREELVALRWKRTRSHRMSIGMRSCRTLAVWLHATTRGWTSNQLAVALHADGLEISSRHLRRCLRAMGAGYKRVAR